jgi:membrane associated rhomboid family serine protease
MKIAIWIAIGIVIGVVSWIPINLADPGDIPFGAAILGIVGSVVGLVIVVVAAVQGMRRRAAPH